MTRNKTIFITGASSGIGEACAVGLAERGYRVFAGVRKPVDGERLERVGEGNISAVAIDAIESPNPKTLYLMGHSARLQSLLRRLPDKLCDRVIIGALQRVATSSG